MQYRVLRPYGDTTQIGSLVEVPDPLRARILIEQRFIAPLTERPALKAPAVKSARPQPTRQRGRPRKAAPAAKGQEVTSD